MEKGKKIDFKVVNLTLESKIYDWDGVTTIKEGTDKKEASLDGVKEDTEIIAWVALCDFQITYSVIDNTGGTIELKGKGYRPEDPTKTSPREKWTSQELDLKKTSPVPVKGSDIIYLLPTSDAKHEVDYWIIEEGSKREKKYGNVHIDSLNHVGQTLLINGNTDVKVKFRNYYLLNTFVSNDKAGKLEITKVMRAGVSVSLPLEEVKETDIDNNLTNTVQGYKILDGDEITFKATPNSEYEIKEWSGFGYDDPSTDPDKTKDERVITVAGDLEIGVEFKKKS